MISPDDFRRLALALPQAIERSHMGTVDFRCGATRLRLAACDEATARGALLDAWRNAAPKKLLDMQT